MQGLAKICKKYGVLLIVDEVQTGFGRTGKWFASEHSGIEPDLLVLAKSIASGMPLSAVVGRAKVMDSVQPGGLGGTFGGNPVCLAAALATIHEMNSTFLNPTSTVIGMKGNRFKNFLPHEVLAGDDEKIGIVRLDRNLFGNWSTKQAVLGYFLETRMTYRRSKCDDCHDVAKWNESVIHLPSRHQLVEVGEVDVEVRDG